MTTQLIFRSVLALALACVAAYLAITKREGWGWFLFCALLVIA